MYFVCQIRVPTHEDGRCLFWEFATDKYDLGFGLYFEWTLTPPDKITVNVSESSDEEEDEEDGENEESTERRQSAGRQFAIVIYPDIQLHTLDQLHHFISSNNLSGLGEDPELSAGDLERGSHKGEIRVPTDELIPVYRRDCHLAVHCGSHLYPGCGVYVLKFDNSYSVWRSKWLYYRVYFAR
ncbi:unnamed protein product [Protopolystoma xenopodis]|uniref:GOLD domain-containing protein n=1 Tax=Protopolystoma xenopodis TaxID=117903 RepID=A0A448X3S9_9PLAT|nr:unnamed protein product [Protopolystoma xenopodis]